MIPSIVSQFCLEWNAALAAATEYVPAPADFRGRVVFAYGIVVAVLVLFVAWSRRRDAKVRADVEFLEERFERLENQPTSGAAAQRGKSAKDGDSAKDAGAS